MKKIVLLVTLLIFISLAYADEVKSLAKKILPHEHRILPKALQLLCSGKIVVDGRHTEIKSD